MPRPKPGPVPTRTVWYNGRRVPLAEAADRAGVKRSTAYARWQAGDRTAKALLRGPARGPTSTASRAVRMREEGHSVADIAAELGVSYSYVTSAVHAAGGVWHAEVPGWALASLMHSLEVGQPVDPRAEATVRRALLGNVGRSG